MSGGGLRRRHLCQRPAHSDEPRRDQQHRQQLRRRGVRDGRGGGERRAFRRQPVDGRVWRRTGRRHGDHHGYRVRKQHGERRRRRGVCHNRGDGERGAAGAEPHGAVARRRHRSGRHGGAERHRGGEQHGAARRRRGARRDSESEWRAFRRQPGDERIGRRVVWAERGGGHGRRLRAELRVLRRRRPGGDGHAGGDGHRIHAEHGGPGRRRSGGARAEPSRERAVCREHGNVRGRGGVVQQRRY